jgi:hypothetical protein
VTTAKPQIRAHSEDGLRGQKHDIRGREVSRNVEDSAGHRQFGQEWVERDHRVRPWKARKFHALCVDQRLDCWGVPSSHNERGVDVARNQFFRSGLRRISQQLTNGPLGLGSFQYVQREGSGAAPLGTDRHPSAGQGAQVPANIASVEQPQRLVTNRTQGFDARGFDTARGAALDKRDTHARF